MFYYSIKNKEIKASFREATLQGQPIDKSLYFPSSIDALPKDFFESIKKMDTTEMGVKVMQNFVGEDIPLTALENIISETLDFEIPLKKLDDSIYTLELFHGPTLAFKDVGARFMSRCMRYFSQNENQKTTILVATSGDTGGAVANGFYEVDGVEVIILYPKGKVSPVQEKQLTTLGKNIFALEVDGNFDDCQRMVKNAFVDQDICAVKKLSSANSINIARWLPQQLYYFIAYQKWMHENPPVISVPSGNFGNICAGILASKRGMPTEKFIATCNSNDTIPRYMNLGVLEPFPTIATMSNAMDVSIPSNFIRIEELYENNMENLKKEILSEKVSEAETKNALIELNSKYGYISDPHGAVAYHALNNYLEKNKNSKGYFIETAHPVKFPEPIFDILNKEIEMPKSLESIMKKEKNAVSMQASDDEFKSYLMSH